MCDITIVRPGDGHIEDEILKRCRLCDLPMNTRGDILLNAIVGIQRHVGEVENEVANLAEELVPGSIPVRPATTEDIRVCVDECYPLEAITTLDCW